MDTGLYDFYLIIIGWFVICIALFKRELLVQKESFEIILIICILLFLVGLVLHFTRIGRTSALGALLTPLLTLAQYRLFRRIFVKRVNREPKDTFHDWRGGLFWDRLFNILYFTSASLLLMIMIFASQKFADAGW